MLLNQPGVKCYLWGKEGHIKRWKRTESHKEQLFKLHNKSHSFGRGGKESPKFSRKEKLTKAYANLGWPQVHWLCLRWGSLMMCAATTAAPVTGPNTCLGSLISPEMWTGPSGGTLIKVSVHGGVKEWGPDIRPRPIEPESQAKHQKRMRMDRDVTVG